MKAKKLNSISDGKYHVKDLCTYKGNKKICNFYIKNLTYNYYPHSDNPFSFTVELKSKQKSSKKVRCEATIPFCFMNNPSGWLYYEFDPEYFYAISGKDEFDRTINEIINMMKSSRKCTHRHVTMGWYFKEVDGDSLNTKKLTEFGDFADPSIAACYFGKNKPIDYICEYSNFVDAGISNILFSYMLLALLSNFDLLGDDIRPNFLIALTGGDEFTRRKTALFFTNLFNRNLGFGKNDYYMTHIMSSDSFAEIRFKTEIAKDCVLIAFEPDKKHLTYLVKDIYGKRAIDEEHPVRNMCLITTEKVEYTGNSIINIRLPEGYSFEKLDEYFSLAKRVSTKKYRTADSEFYGIEDSRDDESKKDKLMDSIYYYIGVLTKKLITNPNYVNDRFAHYKVGSCGANYASSVNNAAEEAAVLISFGYWLYASECYEDDKAIAFVRACTIYETVKQLFLTEGTSKAVDFENAQKICMAIDSFFEKRDYKAKLIQVGTQEVYDEARMWYDDEYLYIRQENIKEFLKLNASKLVFNIKVKVALAEQGLIKKYTKADGKPEYSVHIQKSLRDNSKDEGTTEDKKGKNKGTSQWKSPKRYIAFDRKKCEKYHLFARVENVILERNNKAIKEK